MLKGAGKPVLYVLGGSIGIVTLKLVPSLATLTDETGRRWLDLRFDDKTVSYDWSRTERIDLAGLRKALNDDYQILPSASDNSRDVWYQLEVDGQRKVFQPKKVNAAWQEPTFVPDIIYVAQTAILSADDEVLIRKYCANHPKTKLICDSPIESGLVNMADWLFIQAENRATALQKSKRLVGVKRVLVRNKRNWWLSDGKTVLEGEITPNFPEIEWLRVGLAVAQIEVGLEDQASLIMTGIKQIEAGQVLALRSVDLDYVDFECIKIIAGRANFSRRLRRIRRALLNRRAPMLHLDDLAEVNSKFQSKNYLRLSEIILANKELAKYSAILFDPQIVSAFGKTALPHEIFLAVRVDAGFERLPGIDNEKITTGLDGLDRRLVMYHQQGFDLASWRVWVDLTGRLNDTTILANAHVAARFAKIAQEQGIFPLIELKLSGFDGEKLNRLLKSFIEEMKFFQVEIEQVGLILASEIKDWRPVGEATLLVIFSVNSLETGYLPVVRQTLSHVVALSGALPAREVVAEIAQSFEKIMP